MKQTSYFVTHVAVCLALILGACTPKRIISKRSDSGAGKQTASTDDVKLDELSGISFSGQGTKDAPYTSTILSNSAFSFTMTIPHLEIEKVTCHGTLADWLEISGLTVSSKDSPPTGAYNLNCDLTNASGDKVTTVYFQIHVEQKISTSP